MIPIESTTYDHATRTISTQVLDPHVAAKYDTRSLGMVLEDEAEAKPKSYEGNEAWVDTMLLKYSLADENNQ